MALLYIVENEQITVTGYEGEISHLQIPDDINGLPVRRIAKSAFARRPELVYAKLPETLISLERFAFYSCPNLKQVVLGDNITDYGDGVFRLCENLREMELSLRQERYAILKELLADNEGTLRFHLHLPGSDACLTFPDYQVQYQEDTWARAIHSRIEGAGFTYRECVRRTGIDFRGYDKAFDRIQADNPALAAQIAMDRLLFPYQLEAAAEQQYADYLRDEGERVVIQVIASGNTGWLRMLTDRSLLGPAAMQTGARAAADAENAEMAAILMNAAPKQERRKSFHF